MSAPNEKQFLGCFVFPFVVLPIIVAVALQLGEWFR